MGKIATIGLAILALIGAVMYSVGQSRAEGLSPMADQMLIPSVQLDKNCSGTVVYSDRDRKSGDVSTYILTAKHCVDGRTNLFDVNVPVYKDNAVVKTVSYVAEVFRRSGFYDLAVLKLKDTDTIIDHVANLPSENVDIEMGDPTYLVGYPGGMSKTLTTGNFGSREVIRFQGKDMDYIRATNLAAPGSSGGALFHQMDNGDYEIIGVVSIGRRDAPFMIWYVPWDDIEEFMDFLPEGN